MAKKLPIFAADDDGLSVNIKQGVLQFPALVLVGSDDYIVDQEAVEETARCCNCDAVVVEGAVHDIMLAQCWESVAKKIEIWLDEVVEMSETAL